MCARVQYLAESDDSDLGELLNVVLVEPGDTLPALDAQLGGALLANPFSGRRMGDPAFEPALETMDHSYARQNCRCRTCAT